MASGAAACRPTYDVLPADVDDDGSLHISAAQGGIVTDPTVTVLTQSMFVNASSERFSDVTSTCPGASAFHAPISASHWFQGGGQRPNRDAAASHNHAFAGTDKREMLNALTSLATAARAPAVRP
jgi:hypothetical protein